MPIVLDISRTVSRLGAGQVTGIDRVEIAYIQHLIEYTKGALFLCRLGKKFAVFDHKGVQKIMSHVGGKLDGRPYGLDWLRLSLTYDQRVARSLARQHSTMVFSGAGLYQYLKGKFSSGFDYYNVAHSNLSHSFLGGLKSSGAQVHVLIHDLIPINFPQYTRADTITSFTARMQSVAALADRIICNSADTAKQAQDWFGAHGFDGKIEVALLGLDHLEISKLPALNLNNRSFLLTVGTIEPRKNHQLLFDVWRRLAENLTDKQMPQLLVVGRRGWSNEAVFDQLDNDPLMGKHIHVREDMSDIDLSTAYKGAKALLFPSFTEGYGLPALEAAVHGLPIICSDLPVFQEFLQGGVTYLAPLDIDLWVEAVLTAIKQDVTKGVTKAHHDFPTWDQHFNAVFDIKSPYSVAR